MIVGTNSKLDESEYFRIFDRLLSKVRICIICWPKTIINANANLSVLLKVQNSHIRLDSLNILPLIAIRTRNSQTIFFTNHVEWSPLSRKSPLFLVMGPSNGKTTPIPQQNTTLVLNDGGFGEDLPNWRFFFRF